MLLAILPLGPCRRAEPRPRARARTSHARATALIDYAKQGGEITVDATSCARTSKGCVTPSKLIRACSADKPFCAEDAGLHEMAQAVVKHLEGRPENARRSASIEARAALTRAYPCAVKK